MINDLANSKALQNIGQHLSISEATSSMPTKEVMVALSKIQIGDLLQGQLMVEGEQTVLKLESGLKLLANLPTNVALNKKLDFWVMGKERQRLLLEVAQIPRDEKNAASITEQAINELGIKDTPEMRQVIEQFVGKQLALIKEQLMQLLHFSRNYDIPTETLTNLVSQNKVPRQEELELLTNLKEQGIKVFMPTFDTLIETLTSRQSGKLLSTLFNLLKPYEVKEVLQKIHLLQYEEEMSRNENSKGDDILLTSNEGVLKEQLEAVQQMLKRPILSDVGGEKWQHVLNRLLDGILQFSSHDQLNKLNKAIIHESLVVHLKLIKDNEKSEIEKLTEIDIRLKQIVKVIKEVVTENGEEIHLPTLENTIEVLDKYKMQGQYFCFPLQLKEHQITGELYFFKPKKQKVVQERGMYIVLALNMPALNKIEIHLVEKSEQISLRIKVENEAIKEQLEQYEHVLLETMESSDIPIEKVAVELLSEKKQISDDTLEGLYHLDFKV